MFADAKGYLITEMVWEEVTDDDEPDPRSNKSNPKSASVGEKRSATADAADNDDDDKEDDKKGKGSLKSSQGAAKKTKKTAAPAVQQKGMMSFFGKK